MNFLKNASLKRAVLSITAVLCLMHTLTAAASYKHTVPLDIAVNGHILKTDTPAYISDNTTFVPIRFVSESLGVNVKWDESAQTVTVSDSSTSIVLKINSTTAYINGKAVTIPSAPHIINERTYLPARFICETLGADVKWSDLYYTVYIEKDGVNVDKQYIDTSYTLDEVFWLARIIEAESGGEPHDGKIAVGNVILNRVLSKEYPNTIYGVIFDKKYGTQFQPVSNGTIYNSPSKSSISAAKLALSGTNIIGDCMYFLNPKISTNFWIVNNRKYHTSIGNHDFYV